MRPARPHIRLLFVQLLFALAVGQLAMKIGDTIVGRASQIVNFGIINDIGSHTYVYSHLLLSVVLISTSWVGWQASKSSDNPEMAGYVFSIDYLVLLLDIFLVICYFIIVRGTELSSTHSILSNSQVTYDYPIMKPDSSTERFWVMVIFGVYVIWDIATKWIQPDIVKKGSNYRKVYFGSFRNWQRSRITGVCFVIAILINYCCVSNSPDNVTLIDWMLISLILVFRGYKQSLDRTEYKVQPSQIPTNLVKPDMPQSQVVVVETHYWLKIVIVRVVPVVTLITLAVIYYFSNT